MKSFYKFFTIAFLFAILCQNVSAQSDLEIFGFFQGTATKLDLNVKMVADMPTPIGIQKITLTNNNQDLSTVKLQQLNLFLRKELTSQFTGWVNLEFTNTYNSKNDWGSLALEEAWVNYQQSDAFNVKAGLITPKFGYFNEIKNRMTLLPYIIRPIIFETSLTVVDQSLYVPEQAFLQISGYIPVGSLSFEYAAFAGNADKKYISTNTSTDANNYFGPASDTSKVKLFGGRLGVKYGSLRLGVSTSFDKENRRADLKEDVPRTRLGFDLGFSAYNFFLEGEYIGVNLSSENTTQDLNKHFYYATLGYNITDQLFAYGSYSYMDDKSNTTFNDGMKAVIVGAGYRPIDSVVLKAAYSNYYIDTSFGVTVDPRIPPVNSKFDMDGKIYQLAVAILF